jgi:hypothetical protein
MAIRGKMTFQKRQKEMARKDKQQRKAARRAQRRLDNADSVDGVAQNVEPSSAPESQPPPEADPLRPTL